MTQSRAEGRYVSAVQMNRLAAWSRRKPVIALMGEFSAGKSTLVNLLLGQAIMPTRVTATRLPPVWLRYGESAPLRVDHAGGQHPVDLRDPASIPLAETSHIRLFCKSGILQHCDLIDTPGISDPDLSAGSWHHTIRYANAVIWCTHASQAWRESERGAWMALPERLRKVSILLATRKDKILSEGDCTKITRRLARETQGLFSARGLVSLTDAIRARQSGDAVLWAESGARDLSDMFLAILDAIPAQRSRLMERYRVAATPLAAIA